MVSFFFFRFFYNNFFVRRNSIGFGSDNFFFGSRFSHVFVIFFAIFFFKIIFLKAFDESVGYPKPLVDNKLLLLFYVF